MFVTSMSSVAAVSSGGWFSSCTGRSLPSVSDRIFLGALSFEQRHQNNPQEKSKYP
jgi:hypothetical protein